MTPRLCSSGRAVSAAAKRPNKTSKFMDNIEQANSNFGDEVSSIVSKQHEIAYKNFTTSYRDALATIWKKANDASMKTILKLVADKELNKLQHMACLLKPEQPLPNVIKETCKRHALDNILGAMTSHLPLQNIPSKEVCELISTVFSDLSEAHKFQAKAARGIADLATLLTPEQMTLILTAAIPPMLQLILPPGTTSPLTTPPPPPATVTMEAGWQDIIKYCKAHILPDPAADCFQDCEKKSPTRVLAAAIYCTLEKKYFDERTPRAEIATMFCVTMAQLTKTVTGVDYESGLHSSTKKRKTTDATQAMPSKVTKTTAADKAPAMAESSQSKDDTLSSSSDSDSLPEVPFKWTFFPQWDTRYFCNTTITFKHEVVSICTLIKISAHCLIESLFIMLFFFRYNFVSIFQIIIMYLWLCMKHVNKINNKKKRSVSKHG